MKIKYLIIFLVGLGGIFLFSQKVWAIQADCDNCQADCCRGWNTGCPSDSWYRACTENSGVRCTTDSQCSLYGFGTCGEASCHSSYKACNAAYCSGYICVLDHRCDGYYDIRLGQPLCDCGGTILPTDTPRPLLPTTTTAPGQPTSTPAPINTPVPTDPPIEGQPSNRIHISFFRDLNSDGNWDYGEPAIMPGNLFPEYQNNPGYNCYDFSRPAPGIFGDDPSSSVVSIGNITYTYSANNDQDGSLDALGCWRDCDKQDDACVVSPMGNFVDRTRNVSENFGNTVESSSSVKGALVWGWGNCVGSSCGDNLWNAIPGYSDIVFGRTGGTTFSWLFYLPWGWRFTSSGGVTHTISNSNNRQTFFRALGVAPDNQPPEVVDYDTDANTVLLGSSNRFKTTYSDVSESAWNKVPNSSFEGGTEGWANTQNVWYDATTDVPVYGSRVMSITRSNDGDAFVASDWIDYGANLNNQPLTFSFSARSRWTSSLTVADVRLQSYPTDGNWANSQSLSIGTIDLTTSWKKFIYQVSFSGINENRFRVILRPTATINQQVLYDGILVEARTSSSMYNTGMYTDISGIRMDLSNNTNDEIDWPLRMRFLQQDNVIQVLRQGQSNWWNPGQVASPVFNSTYQVWYLPSSITISNYATLRGGSWSGSPSGIPYYTYFRENGNIVEGYWYVDFGTDIATGTFSPTLLVSDKFNQQDITSSGAGDAVFQIGSNYHHDMGSFEILDAFGTISGSIRRNSDDFSCNSGNVEDRPITITGPNGFSCSVDSDDGSYSTSGCSTQPLRNNTYTVSIGDYNSAQEMCGSCPSANCSQSVFLPNTDLSSATADFTLFAGGDSWYQGRGVSILGGNEVVSRVPVTCAVSGDCTAALTIDNSDRQDNGIVMSSSITSSSGCNWGECDDCCQRGYDSDWWKTGYEQNIKELSYDRMYAELYENKGVGRMATTWDQIRNGVGGTGLVFVNGPLSIGGSNVVSIGNFLMVVVNGNLTVGHTVRRIDGAFIANNIVISGENDVPLTINGMLYARSNITMNRSYITRTNNNTNPAVRVVIRPDLIFNAPSYMFERLSYIR